MVRNSAPSQDNVRPTNVPVCLGGESMIARRGVKVKVRGSVRMRVRERERESTKWVMVMVLWLGLW
jgi:hypothetical protein